MVEKHDIKFKSLQKLNTLDPVRDPETSDIMLILHSMFFSCPRNYYMTINRYMYIIFIRKIRGLASKSTEKSKRKDQYVKLQFQ